MDIEKQHESYRVNLKHWKRIENDILRLKYTTYKYIELNCFEFTWFIFQSNYHEDSSSGIYNV